MRPILLALVVAACATSHPVAEPPAPAPAPPTPPTVMVKSPIPGAARPMLHDRMQRHAEDADRLVGATTRLEYEEIVLRAQHIATEPRLARPRAGDLSTLNASVPAAFYQEQERLADAARDLAAAAERRDDTALVQAYGRLSQSCVSCHAQFLRR